MKLKFGSVCSGIEAASVAWESLGWKASWFAEIEPFPSAVLSYRFPETMNLGDMTKIAEMVKMGFVEDPDILVGGTPCQAFSVAGSRQSLDDERGQLSLSFITLANTIDEQRIENGKDESIIVWENVPGVLNTKDNAFGCFLGELSGAGCELQPSGKKWTNAGCVFGPQRAVAWRVLDAQYFGVAQRRRRVFVVASARNGFNPAKVLLESDGVRRDFAPIRSAGQKVTDSVRSGFDSSGATVSGKQVFPTLASSMGKKLWLGNQEAFSGDYFIASPQYANGGEVCDSITRKWGDGSGGPSGSETGNLAIHPQVVHGTQDPIIQENKAFPLGRNQGQENVVYGCTPSKIDESKVNTITGSYGLGGADLEIKPLILEVAGGRQTFGIPGNWIGRKPENGGNATEPMDNIAPCQTKTDRHAVAFGIQGSMIGRSINAGPQGSGISDDVSFTLTKGDRHAVSVTDVAATLTLGFGARGVDSDQVCNGNCAISSGLVRRLTPVECERLQGFPDNWTQIPYRNKPIEQCPDGPRYAACGNSMAVPVMRWIAQRIEKHLNEISHLNN